MITHLGARPAAWRWASAVIVALGTLAATAACASPDQPESAATPAASDAAACEAVRSIVEMAAGQLVDLVQDPTAAAQTFLDHAAEVRAAAGGSSPELSSAVDQIAAAYERLSSGAVTGAAPDTDPLRTAVAGFASVCGPGVAT